MTFRALLVAALAVVAFATPGRTEGPRAGQAFGDWVFQCTAIAEGKTNCTLQQTLISQETKKPVTIFTIRKGGKPGEHRLMALLPLGLDLRRGVKGKISTGTEFNYELETCVSQGCLASVKLNGPLLAAISAGKSFSTTFQLRNAKESTSVTGSLSGISEGLRAIGID